MEEIKDGEYVRTKLGTIAKIEDVEFDIKFRMDTGKPIYRNWKEDFGGSYVLNEEIVKHSPNIIDLIEVGDYVNGKLIHKTDIGKNYAYIYYGNCKTFTDYQIKSIVTKDQFNSVSYEV